jgi:sialate O-acetylesterase
MIRDWRQKWGIGDFPFLYVQISSFKSDRRENWAPVREGQRETLGLANTAMAVTIDIGNPNDVHPTDKKDVGHRLSLAARALNYGEHVEYSGPLLRQVTREEHSLRLWFDHAEGGFKSGTALCGFEIAATEGEWVPATAKADGSTITVSSPQIENPVRARYAWENSPSCYFFNQTDLPASPFAAALPLYH